MQKLIDAGITGMTSNPAIFEQAIAGSDDYDPELRQLASSDKSTIEIYERLAIDDVQQAADLLRPVYDRTGCADGYISLEVNPELAYDSQGTIAEARRLFATLDRPNIMIKVPATNAGIQAIETLIGEGDQCQRHLDVFPGPLRRRDRGLYQRPGKIQRSWR